MERERTANDRPAALDAKYDPKEFLNNYDTEEVIKNRVNKYIEETKPLSKYYLEKYPKNYHLINGNQEIEMIKNDILKIVKK